MCMVMSNKTLILKRNTPWVGFDIQSIACWPLILTNTYIKLFDKNF